MAWTSGEFPRRKYASWLREIQRVPLPEHSLNVTYLGMLQRLRAALSRVVLRQLAHYIQTYRRPESRDLLVF